VNNYPTTLTNREKEIYDLVVTGMSDRDIAEALNIATRTVSNHVARILSKYNIRDRKKLIYFYKNE